MAGNGSPLVFETLEEYTEKAHLLVKDAVFGISTRFEPSSGGGSTSRISSKSKRRANESSSAKSCIIVNDHASESTANGGNALFLKEEIEKEEGKNESGETSAVTKFQVLETFVRKGCSEPTPAAVTCSTCDKQLGPYINFGALVGHARHCSRRDLHICEICNERFTRRSLYDKHIFRVHGIGLSDKELTCASCGKGFENESLLHKHLKRTKCGLNEGVKRKSMSSSIQDGADRNKINSGSGSSSSSGRKSKRAKLPKVSSGDSKKRPRGKCKAVALVNHSGHMDWLLSCNTLVCSGEGMSLQGDYCSNEHTEIVLEQQSADSLMACQNAHQEIDSNGSHGCHENKGTELCSQEKNQQERELLTECPFGCPLADMSFQDGNGLCDHLSGATRVKHNNHWDYVVNDRLLHVSPGAHGGAGPCVEDHGSFEFLETDLAFDW